MAEKILKTRVQLKYDSYSNWQSSDLILKSGELAICSVPTSTSAVMNEPAILMKVGDGTKTFSQLPWVSGLAADTNTYSKMTDEAFVEAIEALAQGEDTNTTYQIVEVKSGDDVTGYKLQYKNIGDSSWTDGASLPIKTLIEKYAVTSITNGTPSNDGEVRITYTKNGTTTNVDAAVKGFSNKADKVTGATAGHFAGLDANGNLTDSGKQASDFATADQGGKADSAVQGVTFAGTSLSIDSSTRVASISQADAQSALGLGSMAYETATDYEEKFTDGSALFASITGNTITLKSGVVQTKGAISNSTGSDIVLADVAKTGSFNDLLNKPTGAAVIASVGNDNVVTLKAGIAQTNGSVANDTGTDIVLAAVAKTGAYSDLSGTPTLGSAAYEDTTAFDAAGAAATAKSEVIGNSSTDTYESNTIYGAKKYADKILSDFQSGSFEVVAGKSSVTDPKSGIIYLIPKTASVAEGGQGAPAGTPGYLEWIYVLTSGSTYAWEQIGDTDVDLSGYSTKEYQIVEVTSGSPAIRTGYKLQSRDIGTTGAWTDVSTGIDFTTELTKLSGIESGAQVNIIESIKAPSTPTGTAADLTITGKAVTLGYLATQNSITTANITDIEEIVWDCGGASAS